MIINGGQFKQVVLFDDFVIMIPVVSHFSGTNDASIHWNIAWPAQKDLQTQNS